MLGLIPLLGGVYVHSLCRLGYLIEGGRRRVRTLAVVVLERATWPGARRGSAGCGGEGWDGGGRGLTSGLVAERARMTGSALKGACWRGGHHAGGGGGGGS